MPVTKTPIIHPKTPDKLRAAFRAAKNLRGEGYKYHILAERIGVNVGHLHRLIRRGIEPPDTTEKGRAARKAMFLPQKKRKVPEQRATDPMPGHLYWWRNVLTKDIRNRLIRHAWVQLNGSTSWDTNKKTFKNASPRSQAKRKASRTR